MKEKICVNRKVKTILKKVEITNDILVPDIKPDIISVINTNGMTYVLKEQIENGKIKIEGNVENYIIYLSDSEENRCIGNTFNYLEIIEDERIKENSIINVNVMIMNMETKVLNERKINLNVVLVIKLEIFEDEVVEILSNIEDSSIQKKMRKFKVKNILNRNKVNNSLKEILKVDDEFKITEIFKVGIEVKSQETKMSLNKILAKAEIEITVLYLDEEKNVKQIIGSFPLMTFIEVKNNMSDEFLNSLDYIVRNVFFKIQNEGNLVEFQIDFEIRGVLFEEKEINFIEDLYSTCKELLPEYKNINIECMGEDNNINGNIIKIDESYKINNIKEILGAESNFYILNKKISNNMYIYESEVNIKVCYILENSRNIKVNLLKIPFIYKSSYDYEISEIDFITKDFNISKNGENINVYMEIENKLEKNKYMEFNVVYDYKDLGQLEECKYNMIIYYVKTDDTIWEIAKKFNVTVDSILKTNNIENIDGINVGEKILIIR